MTTKSQTRSPEDLNAGARLTIFGVFGAIGLFLIVLITGKPISYFGNLEASLIYGIGVCIPATCIASLAIYRSRNGKIAFGDST